MSKQFSPKSSMKLTWPAIISHALYCHRGISIHAIKVGTRKTHHRGNAPMLRHLLHTTLLAVRGTVTEHPSAPKKISSAACSQIEPQLESCELSVPFFPKKPRFFNHEFLGRDFFPHSFDIQQRFTSSKLGSSSSAHPSAEQRMVQVFPLPVCPYLRPSFNFSTISVLRN